MTTTGDHTGAASGRSLPPASTAGQASLLSARGVQKAFGSVVALRDGEIDLRRGEIHALVGENGAGKSTLVKILSGVVSPDAGTIVYAGRGVAIDSPRSARGLGIATVFQELTLLPNLTVAQNVLMLRERRFAGLIRDRATEREAGRVLGAFGCDHIDPGSPVADLSLADRHMVEVAKALGTGPRVLLLDEATSALTEEGVDWLFGLLRALQGSGVTAVFISHRFEEVTAIADRITIFRNGSHVGTYESSALDADEAVTLMVGRKLEAIFPPKPPPPRSAVVLEARGLRLDKNAAPLDVALHEGEIVGIGGLAGQGQLPLFEILFGLRQPAGGELLVRGEPARIRSPQDALAHGIGFVPEDRKRQGLFPELTVRDNMIMPTLPRWASLGWLSASRQRSAVQETLERLNVKTSSQDASVSQLSGGNQQKIVLGKWLLMRPRILLSFDVTRGIDVGAKHDIYELFFRLASEGVTILLYSTDIEELVHLCHRVVVLYESAVAGALEGDDVEHETIVRLAVRGGEGAATAGPASERSATRGVRRPVEEIPEESR